MDGQIHCEDYHGEQRCGLGLWTSESGHELLHPYCTRMAPALQGQNNMCKCKRSWKDKAAEIASNRNWYLVIKNLKQWFHSFTSLVFSFFCHIFHLYLFIPSRLRETEITVKKGFSVRETRSYFDNCPAGLHAENRFHICNYTVIIERLLIPKLKNLSQL